MRPVCTNCGYIHYVNPVPTVGIVIEMEGGVVLIKRGQPPHAGQWTFPSGYVEADERLEDAAIREAEEETGLKVEIIELADVNSYPEGPPASGIMVFYRARPVGGALQAGDDAVDARVFRPEEVPLIPFRTHREMMAQWLERQTHTPGTPSPPSGEFVIRRANPEDFQQILELVGTIPSNHNRTEMEWHDALLRLRELPALDVFVAQLTTHPPMLVGCAVLTIMRGLTESLGFLNDMAVLPSYRRRGVGAAMLEMAMRRASDLDLNTLMVNPLHANEQARQFLLAVGFSEAPILQLKLR